MTKIELLAKHLNISVEDIEKSRYDENVFETNGDGDYLVLTDEEADERAKNDIVNTLFAFNSWFLADFTDLPEELFKALQEKYEDANETILKLIERADGGLRKFISKAISADGRGHFINSYDGEEHEVEDDETGKLYFIYRTN